MSDFGPSVPTSGFECFWTNPKSGRSLHALGFATTSVSYRSEGGERVVAEKDAVCIYHVPTVPTVPTYRGRKRERGMQIGVIGCVYGVYEKVVEVGKVVPVRCPP